MDGTDTLDCHEIPKTNKICLFASYGMNLELCSGPVGIPNWQSKHKYEDKLGRITEPQTKLMFSDSDGGGMPRENPSGQVHNYHHWWKSHGGVDMGPWRHRTGGNIIYIDGHIQWSRLSDIWGNQDLFEL